MGDVREQLDPLPKHCGPIGADRCIYCGKRESTDAVGCVDVRAAYKRAAKKLEKLTPAGETISGVKMMPGTPRLPDWVLSSIADPSSLAAAPQPAGEDEPGCDDCDGYAGEGGHCLMCGKDLGAPEPAPSAPADWNVDSSLETWFPYTAERLKALEAENEKLKAQQTSAPAPADVEALAETCDMASARVKNDVSQRWTFTRFGLHEFARNLSGAQQAKDGA